MVLLYIENKKLLSKVVSYIENIDVPYTTNLNMNFDYLIIGEINDKTIDFIKEKNCKIIFLTYIEENNIYINRNLFNKKSIEYNDKLYKILNRCYKVIVSLPYIKIILDKNIKTDIVIIEKEIPIIIKLQNNKEVYNKYKISKVKKKAILIDFDYNNIEVIYNLALKYKKINFIYIGFKADYLLKENELNYLYKLPKNVTKIIYNNFNILSDLCRISFLIINFEKNIIIKYLYMFLLLKKQFIMKESLIYSDYLINSKNCYLFKDNRELFIKINKILDGRVGNLTDSGFQLVKNNSFYETIKKYSLYIK